MRLKTSFVLVLALFTVVLVVAAVMSARIVLKTAALQADEARARVLLERGESILEAEADNLSSAVEDRAARDDTYGFMADRNEDYRKSNLVAGSLKTLRVDAIACYDTNHHAVAGVALAGGGALPRRECAISLSVAAVFSTARRTRTCRAMPRREAICGSSRRRLF